MGDAIVDANAVNLKQLNEMKAWGARINVGDIPNAGTPAIISSTNSFINSISRTTPITANQDCVIVLGFDATKAPQFIKSNNYCVTATYVAPPGTTQANFTNINDNFGIVMCDLSDTGCKIYIEAQYNVTQVVHIHLMFVNAT